ncbi:MAG: hypothetical protein ABI885_06595 [Gammaproteobacteria bacterium]
MNTNTSAHTRHEGVHCTLDIKRPAPAIVVVTLSGSDIGEFGDLALRELATDLDRYQAISLFIDAGEVKGATVEVSSEWAIWMGKHRAGLRQVGMLTGSRYIQMTAEFVRRFSGLADRMTIFTDRAAFDGAIDASGLQITR